jgi:glycosyltransferase involved in cell wall biosynthesis
MKRMPLVTVIIPCYNHSRFLGNAIESALRQSYSQIEIIVVDDGSTDDSAQVAQKYSGVKLIKQANGGLPSARNAGLRASAGDYLIFLDADDRLLPGAAAAGAACLNARAECAFAYGHYRLINRDGIPTSSSQGRAFRENSFQEMLRSNYIGMHATVIYRRSALDAVNGFDASFAACEDYDLYLRVTRNLPIHCHGELVAEYRQHNSNMSYEAGLMLKTSLRALGSQWKYVKGNKQAEKAYRDGMKNWRAYYGQRLLKAARSRIAAREWKQTLKAAFTLLRYYPRGVASIALKKTIKIATRAPEIFRARLSR